MSLKNSNKCSLCDCNVLEDVCHFLLLCPALEQVRRPLLNDISFNTVELDFVDLPNYIKIKLLIGDCGFYVNEIEGMYLDVIGRNLCPSSSRFIFILIWVGVSSKACKR